VVNATWNNDYHTELENFDGSNRFKDDQADASADAFKLLNQDVELPTSFSLPDLSKPTVQVGLFNEGIPTGYVDKLTPLY